MTENPEQTPATQEGADSQGEPSMEEILASIRRIISEDEEAEGEAKKPAAEAEAAGKADAADEEADAETAEAGAADEETADDEVADDEAIEAAGAEEATEAGEGGEDEEDDILELTRVVDDDGNVVDLAEGKKPEAEMTTETDAQAETPEMIEQEAAMADENELVLEEENTKPDAKAPAAGDGDSLVSPPAEAATVGSFEQLAKAVTKGDRPGTLVSSASGKTLEDIVKELLRPMLKEWLDQNLHSITEKLVRKEIERAARRAEEL